MIELTTKTGEKMVLLSKHDYRTLIDDAGDAALAGAASGGPTLPADLGRSVLEGKMHPLTAWRQAAGLTMAALGERAGVRTASVSDIENGRIDPRYSTVKALAAALSLSPSDIME